MESLRKEIFSLITRLEGNLAPLGHIESQAVVRLRALQAVAEKATAAGELTPEIMALRQFWLDSVDWCSQLSRDIEKLLIIQEELATQGTDSVTPS